MPTPPRGPQRMFETRSQSWKEVGLLRQINPRVVKRARFEAGVLVPLFIAVVVLFDHRAEWFGEPGPRVHGRPGPAVLESSIDTPMRVATVIALLILGWAIARDM